MMDGGHLIGRPFTRDALDQKRQDDYLPACQG